MGEFIEINGRIRELVKVVSDCPGHAGFYTTYRDQMKPGDVEYVEGVEATPEKTIKKRDSRRPRDGT